MTEAEWNVAHVSEEIARTRVAALEAAASVKNLRAEVRDAGTLAAETLELLREGFAYIGNKFELIEQRLGKLEAIEERLNEITSLHRASHWIAPYLHSEFSSDASMYNYTRKLFDEALLTYVAIANPGSQSVECSLALRHRAHVEEMNVTVEAGDVTYFMWRPNPISVGWLELTASGWVLPAAWLTNRTIYGRAPSRMYPEGADAEPWSGEVSGEAFAIPWYPVD